MGKLIYSLNTSADGFIKAPDGTRAFESGVVVLSYARADQP